MSMYIYIYIHMCLYVCTHIENARNCQMKWGTIMEKDRERLTRRPFTMLRASTHSYMCCELPHVLRKKATTIHMSIHIYIYTCTHKYIYIYIYTYMYIIYIYIYVGKTLISWDHPRGDKKDKVFVYDPSSPE